MDIKDKVAFCSGKDAWNTKAFPEYGIPSVLEHPFENIIDIPNVSVEPSGKALGALRSYSLVRKSMPDAAVVANVEGPLTKTGTITGIETMIMCMENEKDLVNDIISLCLAHTYSFLERLDSDGSVDCVFLASATDNPDMFGHDAYSDYSLRFVRKMADRIHRIGYPVIFHPHGVFTSPETKKIFNDTIRTGIDGFQFAEDNDPREIVSRINGRCSVLGGTNVVPTLLNGPEDRIRNETLDYINTCKNANYTFMCSCSLHRATPLGNVKTMADAVHDHNRRSA